MATSLFSRKQSVRSNNKSEHVLYQRLKMCGSMILIWGFFMVVDHMTGLRLEYLLSYFYTIPAIKSFKCQDFSTAIAALLLTVLLDMACLVFVSEGMLLYLASSYIWGYVVWDLTRRHLPAFIIWGVLVYIENYVRNQPSTILCRALAAHCIGFSLLIILASSWRWVISVMVHWREHNVAFINDSHFQCLTSTLRNKSSPFSCNKTEGSSVSDVPVESLVYPTSVLKTAGSNALAGLTFGENCHPAVTTGKTKPIVESNSSPEECSKDQQIITPIQNIHNRNRKIKGSKVLKQSPLNTHELELEKYSPPLTRNSHRDTNTTMLCNPKSPTLSGTKESSAFCTSSDIDNSSLSRGLPATPSSPLNNVDASDGDHTTQLVFLMTCIKEERTRKDEAITALFKAEQDLERTRQVENQSRLEVSSSRQMILQIEADCDSLKEGIATEKANCKKKEEVIQMLEQKVLQLTQQAAQQDDEHGMENKSKAQSEKTAKLQAELDGMRYKLRDAESSVASLREALKTARSQKERETSKNRETLADVERLRKRVKEGDITSRKLREQNQRHQLLIQQLQKASNEENSAILPQSLNQHNVPKKNQNRLSTAPNETGESGLNSNDGVSFIASGVDRQELNRLAESNMSLQNTLAAETRFKMDLMQELGKARREIEYLKIHHSPSS
eukprot:CFRG1313T1